MKIKLGITKQSIKFTRFFVDFQSKQLIIYKKLKTKSNIFVSSIKAFLEFDCQFYSYSVNNVPGLALLFCDELMWTWGNVLKLLSYLKFNKCMHKRFRILTGIREYINIMHHRIYCFFFFVVCINAVEVHPSIWILFARKVFT